MAVSLTTMAPMRVGATIIPVENVTLETGEMQEEIRHSGLPFAGGLIVPQRMHSLRFRTFFKTAYDLIGLKLTQFTVLEWYHRGYASSLPAATGDKWSLKTGAIAVCEIQGVSEGTGGVIMADCVAYLLSGGALTGVEDIVERTASQTILTVVAEPTYHVRGPIQIGAVKVDGVSSFSLETGNRVLGNAPTDGRTYPESLIYDGGSRRINIGVDSLAKFYETLGWDGAAIGVTGLTSVIVYLREIDRKGVAKDTGASMTIGKGRITVASGQQSIGAIDSGSVMIHGTNEALDQTDPVTIAWNATGI
jgi:hypothetical protein